MLLSEYVSDFNRSVRDGDWSRVSDWFSDDAVLEFHGVPIGPFIGRAAIGAAYAASPPDDEIELVDQPTVDGTVLTTAYRWVRSGATGTMRLVGRGDVIDCLVVTFD